MALGGWPWVCIKGPFLSFLAHSQPRLYHAFLPSDTSSKDHT